MRCGRHCSTTTRSPPSAMTDTMHLGGDYALADAPTLAFTLATSAPDARPFDVFAPLGEGKRVLEASAGTGKTFTIASLVLRLVAEEGLGIDAILVVTFTEAATTELRERVRARIRDAHAAVCR